MIFAMTQRSRPKSARTSETALVDSYTLAARRLEAERPVRNARLRRIASDLAEGRTETAPAELGEHLARHPGRRRCDQPPGARFSPPAPSGRRAVAIRALRRARADFARAGFDRAKLLFKLDRFQAALDEIERLLTRDAGNPLFRRMKADILRIIGEDARSLALCEELATENPAQAQAWIAYGHALRTAGRRDEAIAAYRKAIECRPCSGLAWWGLAGMRTVGLGDADAVAIEEQLRRSDVPPEDGIALQFSLGKAFEDMRAYDRSFELYAKANAALRLRLDDGSPARLAARAAATRTLFHAGIPGAGRRGLRDARRPSSSWASRARGRRCSSRYCPATPP